MKIYITSVFVDDQQKAFAFYTETLGFMKKHDVPMGEFRWLTLVSPGDPDGPQLLLEPATHPAVPAYRAALKADGIPLASFQVENLDAEHERLSRAGVRFPQPPCDAGEVRMAVLDDTCGNLVQLVEPVGA
ncbi:MAG: bleomycin resistance protein [Gammaproteobacteria bacterium]|nr:bleomycin resistance protein [Gammaproteobacteria bacterium]|tara:strand:+ start:522 stop:914 length:393 start_codon:yes stop_codon:yes gene_type:complete